MTVQENKNAPRIWIEGLYLTKAGFNKGDSISVNFKEESIEILKSTTGGKIVSYKKSPIIDINNSKILQVFKITEKINVTVELNKITISKSKIEIRKKTALRDGTVGELFAGGGLLSKALELAGLKTKWAIEKNPAYAENWESNFNGVMYNSDISEIDYSKLEPVEIIAGGIPCENFSIARQNSDIGAETIDLSMFFMMIVERMNPRTIILEEVPMYLKSEIGIATMRALERLGYKVESKIVSGNNYGELQNRKRAIVIATYDKITLPNETKFVGSAKDILLDEADPECNWFTKLEKPHMFSQKDGKFQPQIITRDTESIQGITRRYQAFQKQNPLVKHSTEEKFRLLTISETRKLMGVPVDYKLPEGKILSGEILGQGVLVNVFKLFAKTLRNKTVEPIKKEIVDRVDSTLSPYF